MDPSSDIWVYALLRRAQLAGAFGAILRKGDARAGAVLVRTRDPKAGVARLYAMATRGDGERVWMQPVPDADEGALDAYAERAARIDPDLWIVEIEDPDARRFLTERIAD